MDYEAEYPYSWTDAGEIQTDGRFSLAWRCLDAQYWGVAQRRKRIYLVADFAGGLAPVILFDLLSTLETPAKIQKKKELILP